GLLPHLPYGLVVGSQVELRHEAKAAHQPERVLREAHGRHRPKTALAKVARAAERVDELAVLEVSSHRVDREVAPVEVVLDARRRVDDDLEVVAARPGRALAPRRRELDPGGHAGAHVAVSWVEAHADRLARDDEILDPAVRAQRFAESLHV